MEIDEVVSARLVSQCSVEHFDGTFTLYGIEARMSSGKRYFLLRRYSQFYFLNQMLFSNGVIDQMTTQLLPPKKFIDNLLPEFIQNRRKLLQDYLLRVLSLPNVRKSNIMIRFLNPFRDPYNLQIVVDNPPKKEEKKEEKGEEKGEEKREEEGEKERKEEGEEEEELSLNERFFGWESLPHCDCWDPSPSKSVAKWVEEEVALARADVYKKQQAFRVDADEIALEREKLKYLLDLFNTRVTFD